jgi:hypothetical protein
MALSHSPGIVTNGLIFYYDMINTKKSWFGEPTTNQFAIPTPDSNGNVSFAVNGTGTFKRIFSGSYGGYDIRPEDVVYRYDLGANGCHYHGNDVTIPSGQYPTFTFDYYLSQDVTSFGDTFLANFENLGSGVSGSAVLPNLQKGVWKTIQINGNVATSTSGLRMLLYPGGCSGTRLAATGFILIKNPQVTFSLSSGKVLPFVAGTRSNTQALRDLTGQNTITATSLTYASDGTFSFNGSADYITIPNTTLGNGNSEWTVSCWMKTTTTTNDLGQGSILSNQSGGPVYSMLGVNNGKIGYWTNQNNPWAQKLGTGKTVNDGNWHMLTWVNYSNYIMDMYVDGLLDSNVANSTSGNNNPVDRIGGSWAGYFPGSIASLMRYTRALSSNEVLQNFASQRGLYGI